MKKPASKVAKPAQIQPKSQFLFLRNLPLRHFSIMTLYTGKCSCRIPNRKSLMIDNMKGRYLKENLFSPENLYKIAGAVHKEIHGVIDAINSKFYNTPHRISPDSNSNSVDQSETKEDPMYQQTKENPIWGIKQPGL